MNRKHFFLGTTAGFSGLFFLRQLAAAQMPASAQVLARAQVLASTQTPAPAQVLPPAAGPQADTTQPAPQRPEPFKLDLVKEFVIAGHGNLSKTQSMINDHPNLALAKFDWGAGDFEAAIEGAGHMGNKEIAEFLIDAGSRVTLYVLTMLGRTELVKPVLEAYPKLIFAPGPHGLTLLHHAKVAGERGKDLYAYLQEKGLKEDWIKIN